MNNYRYCALLHFSRGDVITMECVEKIIKKDWINPLDSTKLTEADIIPLQRVIIKIAIRIHTKLIRY